jgi:hypothetical protein
LHLSKWAGCPNCDLTVNSLSEKSIAPSIWTALARKLANVMPLNLKAASAADEYKTGAKKREKRESFICIEGLKDVDEYCRKGDLAVELSASERMVRFICEIS